MGCFQCQSGDRARSAPGDRDIPFRYAQREALVRRSMDRYSPDSRATFDSENSPGILDRPLDGGAGAPDREVTTFRGQLCKSSYFTNFSADVVQTMSLTANSTVSSTSFAYVD